MKKKNSLPKILAYFVFAGLSLLLAKKSHAQELSTGIKDIAVFDSTNIFSKDIQNIRIAEITYSTGIKSVSNDTIPKEGLLPVPDPIEFKQLGFFPEDLEQLYPNVIYADNKGNKSIDYNALSVVLFKIIQEQDARIKKLELQVTEKQTEK